jgi:hypothetical protein
MDPALAAPSEDTMAFVGRTDELRRLAAAAALAQSGVPQLVLVEGEGGIGKTQLLDRFLAGLDGFVVARAVAEHSQVDRAYSTAGQLSAGLAARSATLCPPPAPPAAGSPLAVGAELVRMLDSSQAKGAVALVTDDFHWADLASAQALTFAWNQLLADRVLIVLAFRQLDGRRDAVLQQLLRTVPDRTTHLHLNGLTRQETAELAAEAGPAGLPASSLERLYAQTDGRRAAVFERRGRRPRGRPGPFGGHRGG